MNTYFPYQNKNKEITITNSNVTKINGRNITSQYEIRAQVTMTKETTLWMPQLLRETLGFILLLKNEHQVTIFTPLEARRNSWIYKRNRSCIFSFNHSKNKLWVPRLIVSRESMMISKLCDKSTLCGTCGVWLNGRCSCSVCKILFNPNEKMEGRGKKGSEMLFYLTTEVSVLLQ